MIKNSDSFDFKLIQNANFEFSVSNISQLIDSEIQEIVFSGRSNVGKSTLINKILNRKKLARTSLKPGKTVTINFFRISKNLRFVDLPGYGYAKVSYKEKKRWSELVEFYFNSGRSIKTVVQLLDSRRGIVDDDLQMINYLNFKKIPFILVVTKMDKLNKCEQIKAYDCFKNLNNKFYGIKNLFFSDLSEEKIDLVRKAIFYRG